MTPKWVYEDLDNTLFNSELYKGLFIDDKLTVKIIKIYGLYRVWFDRPPQIEIGNFRTEIAARKAAFEAVGIDPNDLS